MTKTFKMKPSASPWKVRPGPRQSEKKKQKNLLDSTISFRDATPNQLHQKAAAVDPTAAPSHQTRHDAIRQVQRYDQTADFDRLLLG